MLRDRVPSRGTAVVTISTLLDHCKLSSNSLSLMPPSLTMPAKKALTAVEFVDKSTNTNTTAIAGIDTSNGTPICGNGLPQPNSNVTLDRIGNGGVCPTQISITDVCDKGNEIEPQYTTMPSATMCDNVETSFSCSDSKSMRELNFAGLKLRCMCSESNATTTRRSDDVDGNGSAQKSRPESQCDLCCAQLPKDENIQTLSMLARHANQINLTKSQCDCCERQGHNSDACYRQIKQSCCDDETKEIVCRRRQQPKGDSCDNVTVEIGIDDDENDSEKDRNVVEICHDEYGGRDGDQVNSSVVDVDATIGSDDENSTKTPSDAASTSTSISTTKRNKTSEKLVIDLNDRSKYTKEVSV